MFDSVITKIFNMYTDDDFKGIHPLYQDDWQEEYDKLLEFEKLHGFSTEDNNSFEDDILSDIIYKSELKGFTNGFKLAARLLLEICDKPQIAEKKILSKNNEKSTNNDNLNDKNKGKMCECTLTDAKLLADSISDSLNLLYEFCVMHSANTLEEIDMADGTVFTIKAAAEKLSEIMDALVI